MPDMLTISGLLNGTPEPGKGIWWAAMSRKIDNNVTNLPYSQQAEAKLVADQFWDRALKQATPPEGKEREMYEHMFLPDRSSVYGLAEIAKRKGPVFTAEKCLQIAQNLEAKGNKKMAYLWALRAVKAAQNEKKSAIRKQAEGMAKRLKAEMAVQAVAGTLSLSGEDCDRCMGQLSPETVNKLERLIPLMINRPGGIHELLVGIIALHMAKEQAMAAGNKQVLSVVARMVRAAKILKLAKELRLT